MYKVHLRATSLIFGVNNIDNYIMKQQDSYCRIAIIGLGYVGLPLLCHFATKYQCFGLDIDERRIYDLSKRVDSKRCVDNQMLSSLSYARLTSKWTDLQDCDIFIVTAPTPIDGAKHPDLHSLKDICFQLGKVIKSGNIVVFESTVAPGTTEEFCVPIIENSSSLKLNEDFSVGYSPERINIGDTIHSLSTVPKIVSASNPIALGIISDLYNSALGCETVVASSIKTAEAAKLYENVQRDVLIALANQYSDYCRAEGIDIREVTKCASTKWNFAEVYPGLVGGHCIGVDPYYLLQRAESRNVELPLVCMARNINEYKVEDIVARIKEYGKVPPHSKRILLLGFSYKSDSSDIRNTKVAALYKLLEQECMKVDCYDPLVNASDVYCEYGITLLEDITCIQNADYDIIINVVPHMCLLESIPSDVVYSNLNQFI